MALAGMLPWLTKRRGGDAAPQRAKDDESGAHCNWARGERHPYSCGCARTVGGNVQELPACQFSLAIYLLAPASKGVTRLSCYVAHEQNL